MKKLLSLTIAVIVSISSYAQPGLLVSPSLRTAVSNTLVPQDEDKDKIPPAQWVPLFYSNITITDLKNEQYDIDQVLSSGMFIFIDISATWCIPCWEYHKSGELEKLYNAHGQGDNKAIQIFWAEGDPYTSDDKHIIGEGDGTHGDWTNGGKVPYPIVINDDGLKLMDMLDYARFPFPVFVLVSPMRRSTLINIPYGRTAEKHWSYIQQYIKEEKEAMKTEAPKIVSITAPSRRYEGEPINVSVRYTSFEKPTITYEIAGKKYTATSNNFTISTLSAGKQTITVTATTKLGSDTKSFEIEITKKAPATLPLSFDFEDSTLPNDWITIENARSGYGWTPIMKFMKESVKDFAEKCPDRNFARNNSRDAFVSFSYLPTSTDGKNYRGRQYTDLDDYLVTSLIKVPSDAKRPGITLYFGGVFKATNPDILEILVSPSGARDPKSFTESVGKFVVNEEGIKDDYRYGTISLEKYKGQTIAIAFRHFIDRKVEDKPSAGTLIDDVTFIKDDYLSVVIPELEQVLLYPTQASCSTTLTAPIGSHIVLYNLRGEVVDTFDMQSDSHTIDVTDYAPGSYLVCVNARNGNFRVLTLIVK